MSSYWVIGWQLHHDILPALYAAAMLRERGSEQGIERQRKRERDRESERETGKGERDREGREGQGREKERETGRGRQGEGNRETGRGRQGERETGRWWNWRTEIHEGMETYVSALNKNIKKPKG